MGNTITNAIVKIKSIFVFAWVLAFIPIGEDGVSLIYISHKRAGNVETGQSIILTTDPRLAWEIQNGVDEYEQDNAKAPRDQ